MLTDVRTAARDRDREVRQRVDHTRAALSDLLDVVQPGDFGYAEVAGELAQFVVEVIWWPRVASVYDPIAEDDQLEAVWRPHLAVVQKQSTAEGNVGWVIYADAAGVDDHLPEWLPDDVDYLRPAPTCRLDALSSSIPALLASFAKETREIADQLRRMTARDIQGGDRG